MTTGPNLGPHLEQTTQRVQLSIRSEGRPIDANVELWHTPSYIPTKFRIYTEDGESRPVDDIIETPKHPKTVAVYNTGSLAAPHVERLGVWVWVRVWVWVLARREPRLVRVWARVGCGCGFHPAAWPPRTPEEGRVSGR